MALQGDLHSFALPDVLRLLAGTGKTGRLAVAGDAASGDVWLHEGDVVGGTVTSSPHAGSPADVVFELLRFDGGSFVFEDDATPDHEGERSSVDDAIGRAESLLAEWHEVEAVVPSIHSWVALRPEIDGDQTTVSASQWRALAALGGGATVRELGDHFAQTDLAASRQVKELVEAGLVELGEQREPGPAPAPPAAEADPDPAPVDDLAVLRADDGPVVLETRDDALLPEPLPGEGTSFAGDLSDLGAVDGRSFETADEPSDDTPSASAGFEASAPEASFEPSAYAGTGFEADPADAEPQGFEAAPADPLSGADAAEEAAWHTFASGDTMVDHLDDGSVPVGQGVAGDPLSDAADGATAAVASGDEPADENERGSLLKFLSSTKH